MTAVTGRHFAILVVAFIFVATGTSSFGQNCNSPPQSWGDTGAYESWCKSCGGTVSGSGPRIRCTPGPNWGRSPASAPSPSGGAAAGALHQPFYNLGYGIGQSIGNALFGDPQEDTRRAAEREMAAHNAGIEAEARRAADNEKRQKTYDRLSSQIQLSGGFDGTSGSGLDLMLGDDADGLKPRGTPFFGVGGGQADTKPNAPGTSQKTAALRQRQEYSSETAAGASGQDALPLILGDPEDMPSPKRNPAANTDPNIVDLQDRKPPYIVDPAVTRGESTPVFTPMDGEKVLAGISSYAERLGWSQKKIARVADAMYDLGLKNPPPPVNDTDTASLWDVMKARSNDDALARAASSSRGPSYPAAGTQAEGHDCTILALANAARLPYSVVAARAGELIREASWRGEAERANPQKTIERIGLNGGEVIMLAESFGRAEVVQPAKFAEKLAEGKPVMVNLAPGHEVVLTKTFQHEGSTWYEVMNSYSGPQERQYIKEKELNVLLREGGVVFSPNPGTTVVPLR